MSFKVKTCQHLNSITLPNAESKGVCDECIKTGATWVHLRTCQSCGVTLCCDSSPNRHATKHFKTTGHPVIASAEPGEKWLWCYEHQIFGRY